MRLFTWLAMIAAVLVLVGCRTTEGSRQPAVRIIGPDKTLVGRVISVNTNSHFAVLSFPLGRLPVPDQPLNIHRHGQKVGELKTTRRQLDDNVAADIVSGECQVGDEVSDR